MRGAELGTLVYVPKGMMKKWVGLTKQMGKGICCPRLFSSPPNQAHGAQQTTQVTLPLFITSPCYWTIFDVDGAHGEGALLEAEGRKGEGGGKRREEEE